MSHSNIQTSLWPLLPRVLQGCLKARSGKRLNISKKPFQMLISSYACSFPGKRRILMLDPSSFAYDQQAPFALEVLAERVQNGAIVRDITFASPRGGKVPAYLIYPSQQPPQAGLIFGHWGEGNRAEFV